MKQKTYHLWMLIGVCIFETLTVDSFEFEKNKNRNNLNKFPIFERAYPSIASAGGHIQEASSSHDISGLSKSQKENKTERPDKKENNDTEQILKSEIKNIESKFYNKKRTLHPSKLEDKSHAKRENFFFRLFSDNYKPHKQRPVIKRKRDTNGIIRELEIVNDTFFPPISHSVIPLSHFGRDRKLNDDKICKTQIIKFFPKQMRKSFETKNDVGNESHKQLLFNDNNNEWELRQDIFVEEILPFREKNDFGFKDIFHDEAKTIFDDILSIFTMLPFSIFDTIYVKLSTTEKSKVSQESVKHVERSDYEESTNSFDSLRNKRQAAVDSNAINLSSKLSSTIVNSKETYVNASSKSTSTTVAAVVTGITNASSEMLETSDITNANSNKETNAVEINGVSETNKPLKTVEHQGKVTESEKAKTMAIESEKTKTVTDTEKLNKPVASSQYDLNSSPEGSASTSTVAELSKQKLLNPKDVEMLEMNENEEHYDENVKNAENVEEAEPANDKNAFLMVLGVIPGLVGLIIAVGVVGIWMIQKNSSWVERNNQGNEPTTSSQTKPPHSMNI